MIRIKSLADLKKWNQNPTDEKPVLMEWYLGYFFNLLENGNQAEAADAHEQFIIFTMKCEKMDRDNASARVNSNLDYYSGYASTRWPALLESFRTKLVDGM